MNTAKAKALILRDAMRAAAHAGVTAQAQALLATIIAEAWPVAGGWVAKLGVPVLTDRLNASRSSVKRWTAELEHAELVRRRPGRSTKITEWSVVARVHRWTGEGSPVNPQGSTHGPCKGPPVDPDTGTHDSTERPTTSSPDGSSTIADPPRRKPTTTAHRRWLQHLAENGSKRAAAELQAIDEIDDNEHHTTTGPDHGQVIGAADLKTCRAIATSDTVERDASRSTRAG